MSEIAVEFKLKITSWDWEHWNRVLSRAFAAKPYSSTNPHAVHWKAKKGKP